MLDHEANMEYILKEGFRVDTLGTYHHVKGKMFLRCQDSN